jgi:hypothetical protein
MSKGGRLGLVAVAIVVAVVAFLIVKPGEDDDGGGTPAAQTTEQSPTATAPSAPEPPPDAEDQPQVAIELSDHAVVGGGQPVEIEAAKGDQVRFVVDSDQPDDIHVHGYDIERSVAPGKPAKFSFKADIEGIFEIESHEAEHAGKDAVIAKLVVQPS